MDELDLQQDRDDALVDGAKLQRQITREESEAIRHPGDVRINVKGAFIVDEEEDTSAEPNTPPGVAFDDNGYQHDSKDIRLPNHKAVVSHMAVDVRCSNLLGVQVLGLDNC
jgi:type II pantothenate kinase